VKTAALVAFLTVVAACRRSQPDPGTERGPCKDDHTCQNGLVCLSDLCVRPPAGDCGKVAEALAAVQLGPGGDAAKRASAVAALRAQCESQQLSIDDATCLTSAKGKVAMAKCPHPLLPELVELAADKTGCKAVGVRLEELTRIELERTPDDLMAKLLPKLGAAVSASCAEDGWNDAAKTCFAQATDDDPSLVQHCLDQLTSSAQEKFMKRMGTLVGDVAPPLPPPDVPAPDVAPVPGVAPAPAPDPTLPAPALPAQIPDDEQPAGLKPKTPAK
jgi:hypothetical protein